MGIFRVYLALCVIAAHSGAIFPWQMHDSRQAVQLFFIISGFYMAMVLSSRYATPKSFYISRAMRIFPLYWIVLAGTILFCLMMGVVFKRWYLLGTYTTHPLQHNGVTGVLLTTITNFTLVGQDWVLFLSQDFGRSIHLTSNFRNDAMPLCRYLLVPQCWSVGLELTFYACAPYLNRLSSRWLVLIASCALAARLLAYRGLGSADDPWNYRFFPFEISLFILGMLGYRLYARTAQHHPSPRFRCVSGRFYMPAAAVLLLLLYFHIRMVSYLQGALGSETGILITYPLWIVGIPILFFVFGNQKNDRLIGELSYPIYLIHILVIQIANIPLVRLHFERAVGPCTAFFSIIIAGIFYYALIAPLDKMRHLITNSSPSQTGRASLINPTSRESSINPLHADVSDSGAS